MGQFKLFAIASLLSVGLVIGCTAGDDDGGSQSTDALSADDGGKSGGNAPADKSDAGKSGLSSSSGSSGGSPSYSGLPPHQPGTICITPEFWCWMMDPQYPGARCTCNTPYGPIWGSAAR